MVLTTGSIPAGDVPNMSLRTTEWAPSAPMRYLQDTAPAVVPTTNPSPFSETDSAVPRILSASDPDRMERSMAGRSMICPLTGMAISAPPGKPIFSLSTSATEHEVPTPVLRSILSLTASPQTE